jgi:hypothetical protein
MVDAGRPTYTAQTFGPDRYEICTMQSSWHNVPEIRGTAQAVGSTFAARDVRSTIDGDSALSLELAAAYPRDDIRCWKRESRLDRAAGTVTITDTWELAPQSDPTDSAGPTRIHWLVAGVVELGKGHALIHTGGRSVTLGWMPADAPATVSIKELDDPMLSDVWGERLTRVEIDVTGLGAAGSLVTTISEGVS